MGGWVGGWVGGSIGWLLGWLALTLSARPHIHNQPTSPNHKAIIGSTQANARTEAEEIDGGGTHSKPLSTRSPIPNPPTHPANRPTDAATSPNPKPPPIPPLPQMKGRKQWP